MRQLVDRAVFARRFVVWLLAGFALFALILATPGVYAVVSYSVAQRRQEIGIRTALGATASDLQALDLAQTGRLAVTGMLLGTAASWIAGDGCRASGLASGPARIAARSAAGAALRVVTATRGGPALLTPSKVSIGNPPRQPLEFKYTPLSRWMLKL